MIVQPFIFNWKGKYRNVNKIAGQFRSIFEDITVINSDDDYCPEDWVNIGDDFYFSGQFNTALKYFSGDIFFHVQGDVSYNRWQELVDDAIFYMQYYDCGIYAPNINHTHWPTEVVKIKDRNNLLEHESLDIVSCTDETVWFIHRDVLSKIGQHSIHFPYSDFGWGIDFVLSSISFLNKKLVLRDSSHTITHPKGRSYSFQQAMQQLKKLKDSLPLDVLEIVNLIQDKNKQDLIYKYLL